MPSFKSITAALVLLALSAQTSAHVIFMPAMGVDKDTAVRSDVTQTGEGSGTGAICGGAKTDMDTTRFVSADASGSFNVLAISFNGGVDGSRKAVAKVDTAGLGGRSDFKQTLDVTKNGDENPSGAGQETITATLGDAKCTGGKNKNRCLVSFTSTSGGKFGDCVVVEQSGGASAKPAATTDNNAAAADSSKAGSADAKSADATSTTSTPSASSTPSSTPSASSSSCTIATTTDQAAKDQAAKDEADKQKADKAACDKAAHEKAMADKAKADKAASDKAASDKAKKDATTNNAVIKDNNNNASCGKPSKRSFVPVGTRAARALRALLEELEGREEDSNEESDVGSSFEEIEALFHD